TTGRVIYHWHGGEMTRRAEGLRAVYPEALVEISLEDAQRLAIADGDPIRLVSRRGDVGGKAQLNGRVAPGLVFATFHFPDQSANWLTSAQHLDPVAKIPEFKVTAVRLEKA
ncbi:MAG: molybdopterin dinucleotide binding domain-containing protein, partial [Anaerolineae bacterium]